MSEETESVLAHLKGSAPDERIEIAVRASAELHMPVITFRHQAWGNGIGWFTQSSVDVPAASLTELKRALCLVPGAVPRDRFLPNANLNLSESEQAPTVIPFPGSWSGTKTTRTSED